MTNCIQHLNFQLAVVFAAESVPTFGPLLDLIGASTITLTSLIFPCIFYLQLRAGELKLAEGNEQQPNTKNSSDPIAKFHPSDAKRSFFGSSTFSE